MTSLVANLLVDIVIVVLLVVTICYCSVLNRRIKVLQDSKSELAQLLKYFDESTQRASESIIALQSASKKIGENIQRRIDKANYVIDDLTFLIEKGNKMGDQMEARVAVQRARSRAAISEPEEDYNEEPQQAPEPVPEIPTPILKKTNTSLEAVLERVVGKRTAQAQPKEEAPSAAREARSRTEQELLAMLKSGLKG